MAKSKRPAPRKSSTRSKQTKKGFSLWKLSLGLIILIGLGYGFLALKEGELVPSVVKELEAPFFEHEGIEKPVDQQPTKETDTPPSNQTSPNQSSTLDFDKFDLYFTKAFDFAWPAYKADQAIIERPYYTIRYNEEHEQAMWVAYVLSSDSLNRPTFERKDDFREDPRIKTGSADLSDYKGSGYDRGHLAPAADFSYDEFALSQSFYMSNMSPQDPSFNRGVWKKLEGQVRDWANANHQLYVVTGPVLNKKFKTIGHNQVSIPEYYYKIVLDIEKPEVKIIAFLMKNEKSTAPLTSFVVTVDSIESLTGLDFFPEISDDLENGLESAIMTSYWFKSN